MRPVKRALLSVSDKTGLIDFARGLVDLGVELISTGGTLSALVGGGTLPVKGISEASQTFLEMLDGRVKTLHPGRARWHPGRPNQAGAPEGHRGARHSADRHGRRQFLYPIAATVAKPDVTWEDASIENIDIGGPSMVRVGFAKNHHSVAVVVSPESYPTILDEMQNNDGAVSAIDFLRKLAGFGLTRIPRPTLMPLLPRITSPSKSAARTKAFPPLLSLTFDKVQDLRYGENPHQKAAFYRESNSVGGGVATAKKLHGKELSFNNINDLNGAYNLVQEFAGDKDAAAAIIKHANPCGLAVAPTLADAFQRARAQCTRHYLRVRRNPGDDPRNRRSHRRTYYGQEHLLRGDHRAGLYSRSVQDPYRKEAVGRKPHSARKSRQQPPRMGTDLPPSPQQ